ncbi:MAG TPA: hypothetical protein ENK44_08700 [Caldithrix abyssi]|uniref:YncE family protein n=1 Tax=Caldithrix abyssi TaxID=187145 RepID=A0A7V4U0I2_CALAY|nr:hypothetical protein [Caldithrix abyssi]
MLKFIFVCFFSFFSVLQAGSYRITEVNFLPAAGLNINAAGPLLVRTDAKRNRILVAHTQSSAVSVISGDNHSVQNIPLTSRAIQHLKEESFTHNPQNGQVYLIGDHCLHIANPETGRARSIATDKQYEMVAVNPADGRAFLVGRESRRMAVIDPRNNEITYVEWAEKEEPLRNLNQTPPPPIRKVLVDEQLNSVFAVDGYTGLLYRFDLKTLKLRKKRTLPVQPGARWHWAGVNKKTHHFYLVIENARRRVKQAIKIDLQNGRDMVVDLPSFTEAVGINYNPLRDEIYIPYDNHPSLHVVDFRRGGTLSEVALPLYGNDASAIDAQNNRLYVASWAYGEIEIIDLTARKFIGRIPDLGILPHTFTMCFNPNNGNLYIPIGATAVNGTFGAAVTFISTHNRHKQKIYTGWAPVDLIQLPGSEDFLVFNSEDQMARVQPDGTFQIHPLPFDYPHQAAYSKEENIYVSYGPHQSYWPDVYIWGAKDGIMRIDKNDLNIWNRRIPRLAQRIIVDKEGRLYALQNSWGKEPQFLTILKDEVREFNARERLVLPDTVSRETIQRILKYDEPLNRLYVGKAAEADTLPGYLQIIDLVDGGQLSKIAVGPSPSDLYFDSAQIYVSNFLQNSISVVNKKNGNTRTVKCPEHPVKLAGLGGQVYCLSHSENILTRIGESEKQWPVPAEGARPDNLYSDGKKLWITAHAPDAFYLLNFDPQNERFETVWQSNYPYGDTRFDHTNNSFYLTGQFADCVYRLNQIRKDKKGRLWIMDFLSGRLFIVEE